ncbi:hypothetical protein M5362_11155 [Streptomyces sp. Je 1-79]|uniref:hypothetical protein n=1 Tax=Streptomyces sp. Je 1-79 TaxID=2943847 RepID=UPI0021A893D7|nr:hypothetical protein [Streptomyces sp. Je 1-79]MCT4353686.1 hypothetical protein [Streptomyces sp. Je 1-79]
MSGPTKAMSVITVAALVLTTAYTVALGSSGWLWFGWVVLGVVTIGMAAADSSVPAGPGRRGPGRPGPQS